MVRIGLDRREAAVSQHAVIQAGIASLEITAADPMQNSLGRVIRIGSRRPIFRIGAARAYINGIARRIGHLALHRAFTDGHDIHGAIGRLPLRTRLLRRASPRGLGTSIGHARGSIGHTDCSVMIYAGKISTASQQ